MLTIPRPNGPAPYYGVQLAGLGDFSAFVDREISESMVPTVITVRPDAHLGRDWGETIPCSVLRRARHQHWQAHHEAVANLDRYVQAAALMVDVAERLLQLYRTTDDMAVLTVEDVLAIFEAARADQEQQQAEGHTRISEVLLPLVLSR